MNLQTRILRNQTSFFIGQNKYSQKLIKPIIEINQILYPRFHMQDKLSKYSSYISLSNSQRQKLIKQAKQNQKPSKNPQGDHVFPEINFIKFSVKNQNGQILNLTTYRYKPNKEPVAVVNMFHGLNSYMGHGAHIAYQLAKVGVITVGFDHRGFGRSQGKAGVVSSLESHLSDCMQFVKKMKQQYPNLPYFCLGLSMGGMATYHLTLKYPQLFEGGIMMAPAIKNNIDKLLAHLAGLVGFVGNLFPNMKLAPQVYGLASKNPEITEQIKKDPYVYKGPIILSTGKMLVDTMDKSPQTFKGYSLPFLVIQGGLDKLVNPMGGFELFEQSNTPIQDKQILFYVNMWHDIWHEDEIYEIIGEIVAWILQRLEKRHSKLKE